MRDFGGRLNSGSGSCDKFVVAIVPHDRAVELTDGTKVKIVRYPHASYPQRTGPNTHNGLIWECPRKQLSIAVRAEEGR